MRERTNGRAPGSAFQRQPSRISIFSPDAEDAGRRKRRPAWLRIGLPAAFLLTVLSTLLAALAGLLPALAALFTGALITLLPTLATVLTAGLLVVIV